MYNGAWCGKKMFLSQVFKQQRWWYVEKCKKKYNLGIMETSFRVESAPLVHQLIDSMKTSDIFLKRYKSYLTFEFCLILIV
jgi:hypothetical protein